MYLPKVLWENILKYTEFKGNFLFIRTVNKKWYTFGEQEQPENTSLSEIMKSVPRINEALSYDGGSNFLTRYAWSYLGGTIIDYSLLDRIGRNIVNKIPWDPLAVCAAGTNNNFNLIIWLKHFNHENYYKLVWDPALSISSAALEGNLEFMKSMYKIGHIPTKESSKMAALKGAIPVLSWLKSINCSMEDVVQYLAEEGNLDGLIWANSNGIPCDEHTLDAAAYGGNIDVIMYLIQKGEKFTRRTLESAACGGNSRTFRYLAEMYPRFVDSRLNNLAARYTDIDDL